MATHAPDPSAVPPDTSIPDAMKIVDGVRGDDDVLNTSAWAEPRATWDNEGGHL